MNREFEIPATPSVARRLMRLSLVNSRVVVDPALEELAEQGVVAPSVLDSHGIIDPAARDLVQELLDLDMRAGVILPDHDKADNPCIDAIFVAARLHGLKAVAILRDGFLHRGSRALTKAVPFFGTENVFSIDTTTRFCPDELVKDRGEILLLHADQSSYMPALTPLAQEFPHTVMLARQRVANAIHMHPVMPTMSAVLGQNSSTLIRKGFHPGLKKIAFVFNLAVSMKDYAG